MVNDTSKFVLVQASCDRASTIKQEFESLDGKIKTLSKYFSTYCKLKGVTSSTDILGSVIDHLRKRKLCRSIYQDLQVSTFTNILWLKTIISWMSVILFFKHYIYFFRCGKWMILGRRMIITPYFSTTLVMPAKGWIYFYFFCLFMFWLRAIADG